MSTGWLPWLLLPCTLLQISSLFVGLVGKQVVIVLARNLSSSATVFVNSGAVYLQQEQRLLKERQVNWLGVGKDHIFLCRCHMPELGYARSWHVAEKILVSAEPQ